MIEIWTESSEFNSTSLRLADQVIMILKKGWFSDFELQEIWRHVCRDELPELKHKIQKTKTPQTPNPTKPKLTQE